MADIFPIQKKDGTVDFRTRLKRKRGAGKKPAQSGGVQWSSCGKGITKPKGVQRFGFTRVKGLSNKAGILLGGAAGGTIGGLSVGAAGAFIGTILGAGAASVETVHYAAGYWNPENAMPPKFFIPKEEGLFKKPCTDMDIGKGKF